MTSPLENLAGPAKPLVAEAANAAEIAGLVRSGRARYEGHMDVGERLVLDTIAACERVAHAIGPTP